jgi:hypothetical protein
VAIMLLGILHFVPDYDEVRSIIDRLLSAVPSGSCLALTHATLELGGQANADAQADWNEKAAVALTPRTRAEIAGFFADLELLEPGIVTMSGWRPDETMRDLPAEVAGYCAVGRKP